MEIEETLNPSSFWKNLAIAVLCAFVLSSVVAYIYYSKNVAAEAKIAEMNLYVGTLKADVRNAKDLETQLNEYLTKLGKNDKTVSQKDSEYYVSKIKDTSNKTPDKVTTFKGLPSDSDLNNTRSKYETYAKATGKDVVLEGATQWVSAGDFGKNKLTAQYKGSGLDFVSIMPYYGIEAPKKTVVWTLDPFIQVVTDADEPVKFGAIYDRAGKVKIAVGTDTGVNSISFMVSSSGLLSKKQK